VSRTRQNQGVSETLFENLFVFTKPEIEYRMRDEILRNEALRMLHACGDQIITNYTVSAKHFALNTYLQRLLRPVWELNLCAVEDDL